MQIITFSLSVFLEVIAKIKPGVDGEVFIVIEVGENVETF